MRLGSANTSNRKKLIVALIASAILAFVFAIAQFNGDTRLSPAVFGIPFWSWGSEARVPAPTPPPVVLQTCNWGDTHRHNLVIAIVGDTSEHPSWLEGSENANWDLAVIYYGRKGTAFACEKCMHIELGQGAKWKLIYQFTQSGAFAEHYAQRYSQIYIPDDDIVQLSSSINKAFDVQEVYGLDLAQPALCSRIESESIHKVGMYMEASTVLRYGTFVEIMVPLFSMDFFKGNVTYTLSTSSSGYGLDWIWPFLLGYPQDRIAVIDEVCVIHPHKPLQERGKVSMYDVNPTFKGWELEEEKDQFAKFGYSAKHVQKRYGISGQEKARLGQVWQPWYADLLKQGNLTEQHVTAAQGYGPAKGVMLVQPLFQLAPWEWPESVTAVNQAHSTGSSADLLIVLVVYEGRQPRWLRDSIRKAWNVIVVAPRDMVQVTCPHCLFVHRYDPDLQQGRYALLYQLMQSSQWSSLAADRHNFLYFPEETIVHDVSAISTLVQLSIEADLDLAHLTWCSSLDSYSDHMMYMRISPIMVLRYGTYVDTAAPLFSWPFLHQTVLPTLADAQTGEGLGWLWPYLAGYPKKRIAVIDAACALRPCRPKTPWSDPKPKTLSELIKENARRQQQQQELQTPAPTPMLNEEQLQLDKFEYNPIALKKPVMSKQVLGFIQQPWYQQLMASGNFQAVTINKWLITAARADPAADRDILPLEPIVRDNPTEGAALTDSSVTDKAILTTLIAETAFQGTSAGEAMLRNGSSETAQ